MADDADEHEVSISAELTPTGVKAGAKSRLVAAVDRLGGNLVDLINTPLENHLSKGRAVGRADVKLIDQLGDLRLEELHHNPDFAAQALERHLKTAISRQENKAHVVVQALEDLRNDPPTDKQSAAGPDTVSDDFMNRFERYAEDATSDDIRQRWGRVLASEIRKPGTFSAKVLRIVDELDPTTAALFETVCENRISSTLPVCLLPDISFDERKRLITAGLLLDPGLTGQVQIGSVVTDASGVELSAIGFEHYLVAFPNTATYSSSRKEKSALVDHEGLPSVRVWVLTDEAHAISSILPDLEAQAFARLVQIVAEEVRPAETREYKRLTDGNFQQVRSISRPADSSPHSVSESEG